MFLSIGSSGATRTEDRPRMGRSPWHGAAAQGGWFNDRMVQHQRLNRRP